MTTPQQLRAQADAMEAEASKANIGKVYVAIFGGLILLHEGRPSDEGMTNNSGLYRELTDAEIQALRTIPEFAARLDKVRGA